MTAQLDIDRLLDGFLADGANELADRVLDAALDDIRTTRQGRAWRAPWRYSDMPTPLRLLAAAAILAAAVGGVFLLGGSLRNETPPIPNTTPTTAPFTTPQPSRGNAGAIPIGADLHGRWRASRPAAFGSPAGDYDLNFPEGGYLTADAPNGEVLRIDLIPDLTEPGYVTISSTQGCPDPGTYAYALASDFRTLTFEAVDDACPDRATLLAGNWNRTVIEYRLDRKQPYTFDMRPRVTFEVPAGFAPNRLPMLRAVVSGMDNELWLDAEDFFVLVHTNGQVQFDRCDRNAGLRANPDSLDDFIEWNRAATGVNLTEPVRTTVVGHDAVAIDVGGTDDCPNDAIPVNCRCVPATGLTDVEGTLFERIWAVDVDGQIVLILFHDDNPPWLALTPERLAVAQEFIDSIQLE